MYDTCVINFDDKTTRQVEMWVESLSKLYNSAENVTREEQQWHLEVAVRSSKTFLVNQRNMVLKFEFFETLTEKVYTRKERSISKE